MNSKMHFNCLSKSLSIYWPKEILHTQDIQIQIKMLLHVERPDSSIVLEMNVDITTTCL